MAKRQYLTTAVDFPNAAPHMGHVMEKILADVVVRWFRLRGDDVLFHLGTDENGIKIQQTAKKLGMTPQQLVDQNAPIFEDLFRRLNVSFDYFIRTSNREKHWPTVIALWNRLKEAGMLEKRSYEGLYCTGCERFVTSKDLVEGICPDHQQAPQKVVEENWFFKLHGNEAFLKKLLDEKKGTYHLVPDWRGNETRSFLAMGLEDVSFSRSIETLQWGVPVPDDPGQVMYVWCDNLTSYISSLGLLTDSAMNEWWDGATVTHVIGKDIARFHALNWPAMLQGAGVKTPDRLLIHGFLTSEGQKMSKTTGNVVDPEEVLKHFGGDPDPLRFYLSHEIPVGNDGDFSWKRIDELYDAKLRNQLGNLLNRVLVMLKKEGGTLTPIGGEDPQISWKSFDAAMDDFQPEKAIGICMECVSAANQAFNELRPWEKKGEERLTILSGFAERLRHISLMLLPFIPVTAQKISRQLGVSYVDKMLEKDFRITESLKAWGGAKDWKKVGDPTILFAPLAK